MPDVMMDIETLGRNAGCIVLSIGAVVFDIKTGKTFAEFYQNIDKDDAVLQGFGVDIDTINWWKKQSKEAQDSLLTECTGIEEAFSSFAKWFTKQRAEKLWCQGMNFDEPIVRHALEKFKINVPWKYYNVRDTRTAYDVLGFNPWDKKHKRDGIYHNAIDDCKHQIKLLTEAYNAKTSKN